jgi:signal transduction histidine kinase
MEPDAGQAEWLDRLRQNAAEVAHDFNNLLVGMQGYAATIRLEVEAAAAARDEHLATISADAEQIEFIASRAVNLNRQLLALVQREVVNAEFIDINDVLVEVKNLVRRAGGEHVTLKLTLGLNTPPVRGDRDRLERILLNLAVNARDAMPEGGRLTIETKRVDIDEAQGRQCPEVSPGRYVELAISDTGAGMSADVASHIFEPFFTTKPEGKGNGLGLAAVYGFMKDAGGSTTVSSERGVGTTFHLYFPCP